MEIILPAYEYLKCSETYEEDCDNISLSDCKDRMIEFAKLHVEAAAKNCLEKYHHSIQEGYEFGSSEIMNSYNLNNIK